MSDKPILFSAPMIRALLAEKKTQTRRICKDISSVIFSGRMDSPYGNIGGLLWVRETWWNGTAISGCGLVKYRADGELNDFSVQAGGKWKPSIFMPRWASRLTLEITDISIERLQDISDQDKISEGGTTDVPFGTIWKKINIKPGIRWEDNPWVWVMTFKVHKMNIDELYKRGMFVSN